MIEPSDDVIEHATVREVAGVFRSRRDLEATVEALQRAGFDRADIDALSNIYQVPVDGTTGDQPEISHLKGQPVIMPDDLASARAVVAGTLGTICAVAAVSWIVASGGGSGSAVLGGLLAGAAAASIGYVATPWFSGNESTKSSRRTDRCLGLHIIGPRPVARSRENSATDSAGPRCQLH